MRLFFENWKKTSSSLNNDKDGKSQDPNLEYKNSSSANKISSFSSSDKRNIYKDQIDKFAQTKENFLFRNGTLDHTNIIFAAIANNSKGNILIYDRDLSGDILDQEDGINLIKDFENFLVRSKSATIEIIIDPDTEINEQVKRKLKSIEGHERIKLSKLNAEVLENKRDLYNRVPYFATGDTSYRIEQKFLDNVENKTRSAFGNFNDTEMVTSLSNLFEKLKKASTPL